MLVLTICLKYNVDCISENIVYKYILKSLNKLKLVLKESVLINFIKLKQIIKLKVLLLIFKRFRFKTLNYTIVKV